MLLLGVITQPWEGFTILLPSSPPHLTGLPTSSQLSLFSPLRVCSLVRFRPVILPYASVRRFRLDATELFNHFLFLFSFSLQDHQNFIAQDETLGPVLLSVKHELLAGQDYVRLILRLQTGTLHEVVPATCLNDQASPYRMAKVSTVQFI